MSIVLKTLLLSWLPQTPKDVLHLVNNGCSTTKHSMHSTISTTLKARPGAPAFFQDMLLNIPFIAEWQTIFCNQEALVNNALIKTNQQHINYDYLVGQCVLKYDQTVKGKLTIKISVPFPVVHVNVNSTIIIQLRLGVTECIYIHHTIPYNEPLIQLED